MVKQNSKFRQYSSKEYIYIYIYPTFQSTFLVNVLLSTTEFKQMSLTGCDLL